MKKWLKSIYYKIDTKCTFCSTQILRFIIYRNFFNSIKKKIRGSHNHIRYKNAILNNVVFNINGKNNTIEISSGVELNNVVFNIKGNNHQITIQKNCKFREGGTFWMEHSYGTLIVGEGTTMINVHIAVTEDDSKIIIGKDCMFAYNIDIRTGDSHSILDLETGQRINYAKNIFIGDHVWIAAHSCILKGVQIADDCVVGISSVVTKSIEQKNVIVAGNPAKIIKRNITWDRKNLSKKRKYK